ncbi:MAG: transposase [Candidatus Obscuribacterales bacterium]|nr:transposase [Candidatus Obscuribacterales bacterium]
MYFIEPGKPIQNTFVEFFNGRFRDECLNQYWFTGIEDAASLGKTITSNSAHTAPWAT